MGVAMWVWVLNVGLLIIVYGYAIRAPIVDPALRQEMTTGPKWRRALSFGLFYLVIAPFVWLLLRLAIGAFLP